MVKGGPVAVVTGASRGLGKQVAIELAAKGYHVLLGARDAKRLAATTVEIEKSGGTAAFRAFDQTDPASVEEFADWVKKAAGKIDALVNCAGVALEDNGDTSVLEARSEDVIGTIESNLLGPWRLVREVGALLARNGRIVNVSSGMGALTDMDGDYFGYRASKAGLNVLTRTLAHELKAKGILVNSVCPGWVKTDMGGPGATRSLTKGAAGIVWAATLQPGGPSGGFFRDGKAIDW
jgi:NAD(P)-dependent dehydrogenase (short-subunit alcohol dehydrogenase family)